LTYNIFHSLSSDTNKAERDPIMPLNIDILQATNTRARFPYSARSYKALTKSNQKSKLWANKGESLAKDWHSRSIMLKLHTEKSKCGRLNDILQNKGKRGNQSRCPAVGNRSLARWVPSRALLAPLTRTSQTHTRNTIFWLNWIYSTSEKTPNIVLLKQPINKNVNFQSLVISKLFQFHPKISLACKLATVNLSKFQPNAEMF
jgi:hypothetical protein